MKKVAYQLSEGGFTIVELLATIVVIGLVTLSIANLYYTTQTVERRSNYLDQATRAAQREIEILRNSRYSSLTPGQTITFTNDLPSSLPSNKSGTVAVTQPMAGLIRVDVTVSYKDAGKQQQVVLSSEIGEIGLSK